MKVATLLNHIGPWYALRKPDSWQGLGVRVRRGDDDGPIQDELQKD